jgi:hypothetical protein
VQPVGDARGERRDDDLVVRIRLQSRRDGQELVLGADESFNTIPGRVLQQRNGESSLIADSSVSASQNARHEEREAAGTLGGASADLGERRRRRGGAVRLATIRTLRGNTPSSYSSTTVTSSRL